MRPTPRDSNRLEPERPVGKTNMRTAVASIIVALAALIGLDAHAARTDSPVGACGFTGVTVVSATTRQVAELCAAIAEVRKYFAAMGLAFEPTVSVAFTPDAEANRGPASTHGSYSPATREITMYVREQSSPWGEPWPDVGRSFLHHELAHMAIDRILGARASGLPPEWHEFVAYVVQFELMSPELRERILKRHADIKPATNLMEINAVTHGLAEPGTFAVFAYKTYGAFGRVNLIRRLLTFELAPEPLPMMPP